VAKGISTTQLLSYCILLHIFFLLTSLFHAQLGFGDDGHAVLVDGGLSLQAEAGVGCGAKKLKERTKKA
jgi:hypothetical protein